MQTSKSVPHGKPGAGIAHVRLDEGNVALAKPRRGSLRCKKGNMKTTENDANVKARNSALVPSDMRPLIHEIRDVQVMLDRDLAALCGVTTGAQNQALDAIPEKIGEGAHDAV